MVKRSFKISGLLVSMLLLASSQAQSAGLGRLSVLSSLGQPLNAEIELLSVQQEEIGLVEASLAGADAFRQAGIERSSALSDLRFSIDRRANGQPVVKITSSSPVSDPFVDMLIELNWNTGRIVREYTVLLNPARDPVNDAPARVVLPSSTSPLVARPEPVVKPQYAAPDKPAMRPQAQPPKPVANGDQARTYGPVKSGETLRSIAAKVAPSDVSTEMMVASLYEANKQAFAKENMNLLKRGQVLTVPDAQAVMNMHSPQQAKELIQKHSQAWHDMRNRVADRAVAKVAQADSGAAGKGRVEPAKPEQKPAAAAPRDVLKLSKGELGQAGDVKSAQRVSALEEEVAAKSRALQEAQDRVGQLEQTVEDLKRLMALKEGEAAKVAAEAAAAAPAPIPEPAAPVTEVTPAEPELPAVAAVEPPPEEPGFLSSLLSKPLYIGGAAAALLLSALSWLFLSSRRRRSELSGFEQSVMTGGDHFKTAIFKTESAVKTETSQADSQSGASTDFSRLGLGNIDTHEVDPIAEAEVYMAYGRDAQAEEILKEALGKDPGRHEIVMKLLEIFANRKDTASFETQASELYAQLGDPASPVWQQAADMGRKLDPANPLYRVYGDLPTMPVPPVVVPEQVVEAASEPVKVDEPEKVDSLDVAFDQLTEVADQPIADAGKTEANPFAQSDLEVEAVDTAVEYPNFGQMDEFVPAANETVAASGVSELASLPEEPVGIDLAAPITEVAVTSELSDLSLDDLDVARLDEQRLPEPSALPDLDFSGIDLDLTDTTPPAASSAEVELAAAAFPEGGSDLYEEVNTKLDLARAYLEMGDKEGAREILDEVVKEGDADQRQDAQNLIASL
jgi:pilus assembly protein FimV